jgi:hypothetical protein
MFVPSFHRLDFRDAAVAAQGGKSKHYVKHTLAPADWFASKAEDPQWILDTVRFKTAWHLIGL